MSSRKTWTGLKRWKFRCAAVCLGASRAEPHWLVKLIKKSMKMYGLCVPYMTEMTELMGFLLDFSWLNVILLHSSHEKRKKAYSYIKPVHLFDLTPRQHDHTHTFILNYSKWINIQYTIFYPNETLKQTFGQSTRDIWRSCGYGLMTLLVIIMF